MKSILLLFLCTLACSRQGVAQNSPLAKIYIGIFGISNNLRTTLDPNFELDISIKNRVGYTLVEIDQDSLGLILANGQVVFLQCEAGKSYYYLDQKGDSFGFRELSANAFWLTMATQNVKRYNHYIITKKTGIFRASDGLP